MNCCTGNPLSRRSFLTVGAIGGLGLTLPDLFRLQQAQGAQKDYVSKEGTAKSVIYIFLPGGIAHQETFDPKPYAPVEYRGPLGSIETNVPGVRLNELLEANGHDGRQAHHLPLDDARRSGPRTRHAQHVHGLPAQPGARVSELRQRGVARIRAARRSAAVRVHSEHAEHLRGHRLLELVVRRVQPGRRPGARRFSGARPAAAGRRRRRALRQAPQAARHRERSLPQAGKVRRAGCGRHELPAGLRADQLAEGPRGVRYQQGRAGRFATSTAATRPARECCSPGDWSKRACGSSR